MLERGEKIELLVEKTEEMNNQALNFKKSSVSLKRAMWWKNAKLMAILVVIVLVRFFFFCVCIFVSHMGQTGRDLFHHCHGMWWSRSSQMRREQEMSIISSHV